MNTPAPWKLSESDPDALTIVSQDSTALIAQFRGTVGLEQNQANARLGVLAPEMLAEIKALVKWVEDETDGRDWPHARLEAARALIARADHS